MKTKDFVDFIIIFLFIIIFSLIAGILSGAFGMPVILSPLFGVLGTFTGCKIRGLL